MLRTALMLGLLTGILLAIGFFFAGILGMTIFLILAFVINFAAYWYSDKWVLAMYKAKEASAKDEPELHKMVEKLAREAKIPKPKICMINSDLPNAFATGRNPKHAAVAVTKGLMKNLDDDEVEGVVAHELAHIKNRDTLTSTVAATVAGAIAWIAQIAWFSLFFGGNKKGGGSLLMLPLLFLAPLAATMIQLAISRAREFKADYTGALVSKKPLGLASALQKISTIAKQHPVRGNAATSHLFIINPFKADSMVKLFSTHPPTEERIKRLKEIKI